MNPEPGSNGKQTGPSPARRWELVPALCLALAVWLQGPFARAQDDDLVFIHHSVGNDWLTHSLHNALLAKPYIDERNDIYYGSVVSSDSGRPASLGGVPGDNTDMRHWIYWFNDYLGHVKVFGCANGTNRIIMFKSCYPNSNVDDGAEPGDPTGDQTVPNYKALYRHPSGPGTTYSFDGYTYKPLEDVFAENPHILFIPVTAPPGAIEGDGVTAARAACARGFNDWLKNVWLPAYNAAHPGLNNVAVFDFFDVLAYPSNSATYPNRLHADYGGWGDGHPNGAGDAAATAVFATNPDNFLDAAWTAFGGGGEPGGDTTPPANITGMTATATPVAVYLAWTNPPDADWAETVVQRQTGSYPSTTGQGSRVYAGTGASATDGGVTNGVRYYYTAFARDESNNWSAAVASAQASVLIPSPGTGATTVVFQDGGGSDPAYAGCEDSFIASFQSPYQNVGAADAIRQYRGSGGDDEYRMVIKFDLSNLPEGASVTEATLELYQYEWDGEAPPHTISAYRLTRAWVEGTGTAQFQSDHLGVSWEEAANGTAWTTPGGDYDTATDFGNGANGVIDSVALTSTDGAWQAWDVTPIVEAWAAGTLENHGLILISVAGDWSEHYFRSADHGTAATRPRLGVTYSSGSGSDDHPRLVMNNFNAASEVQLTLHQLETGRNCEIQAASNLVAGGWSVLHTFTATGSVHFWTDDGLANVTSRYYRFRQP